jgi:hypothetical protein
MAEIQALSPAVMGRTAKVVRAVHGACPGLGADEIAQVVLGGTQEAMGHAAKPSGGHNLVTGYSLDFVNVDEDLEVIAQGIKATGSGRLCLYGPPGTGKSAYGHYLARELGRPLMARRASALLSPWVGATEQNLARMFREATREGAVLLLDEADSFLRDRQGAHQSWEVTQVNEVLTQVESYGGVFIATTNLMNSLDAAAMRRFDLKIKFDFMRADQIWAMFQDVGQRLGIMGLDLVQGRVRRLEHLTPGDFATVASQARFRPIKTAEAMVDRLEAEIAAKPGLWRRKAGFQCS